MSEVVAKSKYIRVSPKKLLIMARAIKGLPLLSALAQLKLAQKRASGPLLTTLKSAVANASQSLRLKPQDLRIKTIEIGEGPRLKRFRPVARGAAHPYKRRTAHLKVVLEEIKKEEKHGSEDKS